MAKTQSVTSIQASPEAERRSRFIKYTIAMVVRVLCIILAVAVPIGWLTWLFVAGAVFLPYFAVVIANAQGAGNASSKTKAAEAPTISISADAFRKTESPDEK